MEDAFTLTELNKASDDVGKVEAPLEFFCSGYREKRIMFMQETESRASAGHFRKDQFWPEKMAG